MSRPSRSTREYHPTAWLFGLMTATSALSCGGFNDVGSLAPVAIHIIPDSATLLVGELTSLNAVAVNSQSYVVPAAVEWASADPRIATVGPTSGVITAVGVGSTTLSVRSGALAATATITVLPYHPAAELRISPSAELYLSIGDGQRLTSLATDIQGRATPAPVEWTSENPGIATVGRVDGQVTAIATGSTTVIATAGAARATLKVQVVPGNVLIQWASTATASSQYDTDSWSPAQATGAPDVASCDDEARAWASANPNLDWLELVYQTPVRPLEIHIYEVWAPGSIVKVEVKDLSGAYHSVYIATPRPHSGCLNVLRIPITTFTEPVTAIRVTIDQRIKNDWNEIDAVRLLGHRIP